MAEPIRQATLNLAPYRLTLGREFRYLDPYIFFTTQFGFVRVNAYTGVARYVVGVGYRNPIFPPSSVNLYVVGDQNQTVTQIAVNDRWIVVDNLGNVDGPDPAALVWRNDANLTYHGALMKKSGFWWLRAGRPNLTGDLLYVPNDMGGRDVADVSIREWVRREYAPVTRQPDGSIQGYTYRWESLDGSTQQLYAVVRSDAATEPYTPPPVVEPPPPAPPPPTTEPPPATLPPGTPPLPPPPVVDPTDKITRAIALAEDIRRSVEIASEKTEQLLAVLRG